MQRRADPVPRREHRKVGADLFNYTWTLLARSRRGKDEADELLNAAHASRYHWAHAGGRPLNIAIGEWQISRVYATLGRPEPALYHGVRSLEIVRRNHLGQFYRAYAYEALARAAAVAGRPGESTRYVRLAHRIGEKIRDSDDRRMLEEDLASIPRLIPRSRGKAGRRRSARA